MNSLNDINNKIAELNAANERSYSTKLATIIGKFIDTKNMIETLPKRYQKYSLSTLDETPGNKEAIEAVKNLNVSDGDFILLHGNSGNGKTHLAVGGLIKSALDSLTTTGVVLKVGYVELSEYFRLQRARMYGERVSIPDYAKFDLLVIDDLGKLKPTDWNYQEMFNLLERRWSNEKSTIITTNYSLEELPIKLSPSESPDMAMLSRLTSGKVFEIKGKDRR